MEEGTIFWLVGGFECTLVLSSISEADLSAAAPDAVAATPANSLYSLQQLLPSDFSFFF